MLVADQLKPSSEAIPPLQSGMICHAPSFGVNTTPDGSCEESAPAGNEWICWRQCQVFESAIFWCRVLLYYPLCSALPASP